MGHEGDLLEPFYTNTARVFDRLSIVFFGDHHITDLIISGSFEVAVLIVKRLLRARSSRRSLYIRISFTLIFLKTAVDSWLLKRFSRPLFLYY